MPPEVTLDRVDQKLTDLIEQFERHDALEHEFQDHIYDQLIKLDRLVQIEAARKWHIRTMWGAWIAATLGWLYSLLHSMTGGGKP